MMNSLVATALVLLLSLGFGCSQETELNYTDPDGCIKILMRFEINVTYPQDDGNEAWVIIPGANFTNDVLANCSATDSDGDIAAFINIVWPEEFTLTLNFVADVGQSWNISSATFTYSVAGNERYFENTPQDFDGDTLNGTINDVTDVGWNTSYNCALNSSVDLMSETEGYTASITIPSIQVQVFSFLTPGEFTTGLDCQKSNSGGGSDDDDKIVPIAVGCALAGLVIIVLIAYLIGRFRNRKTDTYQVLS